MSPALSRVNGLRPAAIGLLVIMLVSALFRPERAAAHPLGNFTLNRFAAVELFGDAIRIRYVVDMAEIPTYQELPAVDADGDGRLSAAEQSAYVSRRAPEIAGDLALTAAGRRLDLRLLAGSVELLPGQAGLQTLRLVILYQAVADAPADFALTDDNFRGRIGWREIIVRAATGVELSGSDVGDRSVSAELQGYPSDSLSSPLDIGRAHFRYAPGRGEKAPAPSLAAGSTLGDRRSGEGAFLGLVAVETVTLPFAAVALLAAFGLGALHGLGPGHGKGIVAAYFVGARGTARQALFLALTVTAAHTAGVLLLAAVTMFASAYVVPEQVYPVISLSSGGLLIALGLGLLIGRLRRRRADPGSFQPGPALPGLSATAPRTPSPAHDHDHDHGRLTPAEHANQHLASLRPRGALPWRGLLALGISGGAIPSPSALLVLLAAISLHRAAFGFLLILSFSLGLAAVLTGVGLAFVFAGRLLERLPLSGRLVAAAPVLGALALMSGGLVLAVRAVAS